MIGRIRLIIPPSGESLGYKYKIQTVGDFSEVKSFPTCDVFKLDEIIYFQRTTSGDGRVRVVRRASDRELWDAMRGKITVEKIPAPRQEKTKYDSEDVKEKSLEEKNKLFAESVECGDYSTAIHWLLLGAEVDCAINERKDTPLMQSAIKNQSLIATGFLLAVGAHPLSENESQSVEYENGVSANSAANERGRNIDGGIKSLLREGLSLAKAKKRIPIIHRRHLQPKMLVVTDGSGISAQNQDGATRSSMSVGDAQVLQDIRSDRHDASRDWGYSARDDGGFGSYPLMDDFGDESSP